MKLLTPEQCLQEFSKICSKNIIKKNTRFLDEGRAIHFFGSIFLSDAISNLSYKFHEMSISQQHIVLNILFDVNDYIPSVYGDKLKAIMELKNEINIIMLSNYYKNKRDDFTPCNEIIESRNTVEPGTVIVWCDEPMIVRKVSGDNMETLTFNVFKDKTELFYGSLKSNLGNEPHYIIGHVPLENLNPY